MTSYVIQLFQKYLSINLTGIEDILNFSATLVLIVGVCAGIGGVFFYFRYRQMPSAAKIKSEFFEGILESYIVDGNLPPDTFRYKIINSRKEKKTVIYFKIMQYGKQFSNIPESMLLDLIACFEARSLQAVEVPEENKYSKQFDSALVLEWGVL